MRVMRTREQEHLEDILAELQHIRSEAAIGADKCSHRRRPDKDSAMTFQRIAVLASWVQFMEAARWTELERRYHIDSASKRAGNPSV